MIYALTDPNTDEIRYVGKSCSGINRARYHLAPCCLRRDKTYKANWIRSVIGAGLRPKIEVIEEFDCRAPLSDAERFWIAQFRAWGFRLTNLTDGGDGDPYHTPEFKAKIAEVHRGNRYSYGLKRSDDFKERCRQRMLGKQYTKGRKVPEEERARRGAAIKASHDAKSPEQRAEHSRNISAGKRGGADRWSKKYDACTKCHKTGRRHAAIGLCTACYACRDYVPHPTLPAGKWALRFDQCIDCRKTSSPHKCHGLCSICFQRRRAITHPRIRPDKRRNHHRKPPPASPVPA